MSAKEEALAAMRNATKASVIYHLFQIGESERWALGRQRAIDATHMEEAYLGLGTKRKMQNKCKRDQEVLREELGVEMLIATVNTHGGCTLDSILKWIRTLEN